MAQWVYNRPFDCCNETELRVAKWLAQLDDTWLIRWGFYYDVDREGDFLILGPVGGALVMEVKGGSLRKLGSTGRWDGSKRDHPVAQLSAEWRAVIEQVEACNPDQRIPHIAKALCMPDVMLSPADTNYRGIDRQLIIDGNDLADWLECWRRLFAGRLNRVSSAARDAFVNTYGQDVTPRSIQYFISETDKILLRHASVEFELLDMLRENRQLLVQGGPGTGKTWLAFEQAYRWAEEGPGKRVLLLCYNLALARALERMVGGRKPRRGQITVRSWEALARELFAVGKLKWSEPTDHEARRRYFAVEVPEAMRRVVHSRKFYTRYDALVVDEAQDHDTSFSGAENGDEAGWWSIYLRHLGDGVRSPVAAFFDPGQRPLFRDEGDFDVNRLRNYLRDSVHVRLANALRYTRPVFQFLKSLRAPATAALVDGLKHREPLPDGPDVETHEASSDELQSKVGDIVSRWIAQGCCRAHDILVLSPRGAKERSGLARVSAVGAWKLAEHECRQPGEISILSVNKAKGLDSLAVVLVDVAPFAALGSDQEQMDYFMGASRARQLLAVVHASNRGRPTQEKAEENESI